MSRVFTIAPNTFKETIRDRILGVIVLFALAMIVGSVWLGAISLGQAGRMMRDFGLVAVTLFGLVVAVFVGASLVRKEIDKRTVFVLFSKPLGRSEFIVGKFLGLCATLFVVTMGMGVFLFRRRLVRGEVTVVRSPPGVSADLRAARRRRRRHRALLYGDVADARERAGVCVSSPASWSRTSCR